MTVRLSLLRKMNTKALGIIILGVILIIAGAFLAGLFVGDSKGHTRALAEGNARVVELQKMLSRASQELTQAENKIAEQVSRANQAEKERINAIQTTDHQSERIQSLQAEIDRLTGDSSRLIILDLDAYKRVREAVRGSGQTTLEPSSSISENFSATAPYRYLPCPSNLWRRGAENYEGRRSRLQGMQYAL